MSDTILVPVTTVQPDLVTQTDVVVYVPLASKTSPGIVQIGDGLNINNGVVSVVPIDVPIMSISKNGTLIVPDENKNVNIVIDKSDVGLSNVDNTSDLDKPISNATQQAINIVKNDVDNLSNSIGTIEINITDVDNKQNLDVITDISITGTGDNRYITSTTKNIKTQVVSTDNDQLTLASDTRAGLMSVSDYQQLRTNTSKIEQLENKTSRLIYDEKSNPTASDINNFAVSEGYEPPFAGLSVVVADTYHIWHYYANVGWKDDGLDIVQQFTNTTAGVIMGSELDGKIYAETDGTGSVNGWGALTGSVSSIDTNVTNHINNTQNPHNVTKTQVGLSNVDNTSDIDKPISTAVQSALDLMLPKSEAPTKVSDLENDAAYIKNNDMLSSVQIPYIYNVQRIYSVEDKDHLYGDNGQTHIDLSPDDVSINREYPNTPTYLPAFASKRDGVRDVTFIQSSSTKRLIIDGVEEPAFPSNAGDLSVVSEDDGSYIEANLNKLTVVKNEDGSNKLQQDSKSLIFNWNGLYLNNNEISPNTIRYDIEQTLTDEQKAQARANIGAGTGGGTSGGGTVVTVGGVAQDTWDADVKLDKSFIKTVGDTKITVSMNSDNTPGIVASYEKSGMITDYVASVMTLEDKTILQYISGAKADGTPVYNAISIDENGIEIGVTTDAVGGSGVRLTPDKIEIETPKLTYNGNEVATTNQIINKADAEKVVLLNKEGTQNITSNIAISGDLNISGNIIQQGSAYETHAESVYTKNDYIITRDGAVSGLGNGEYTGIVAKLYDGTNDGRLVFDNSGVARVGDAGDEQPLATREETPIANGFAKWNSDNNKFITKLLEVSDLTDSNTLAKTEDVNKLLENKVDKVDGKELSTNDFTNDYKLQVENNTTARHTHNNKALLDTYTQTETNIADAVAKKHIHNNKEILDNTTASYTTDNALSVDFAESERQKSKNLLLVRDSSATAYDYTMTCKDGVFTINGGNGTDESTFILSGTGGVKHAPTKYYESIILDDTNSIKLSAGTYTISATIPSGLMGIIYGDLGTTSQSGASSLSLNTNRTLTFTKTTYVCIYRYLTGSAMTNVSLGSLQIEEGSVATDYQPYNGAIVHEKEIADVEHIETIYNIREKNIINTTTEGDKAFTNGIVIGTNIMSTEFAGYKKLIIKSCRNVDIITTELYIYNDYVNVSGNSVLDQSGDYLVIHSFSFNKENNSFTFSNGGYMYVNDGTSTFNKETADSNNLIVEILGGK